MQKKIIILCIVFLCFVSVGVSAYFYFQNRQLMANPQAAVEDETQRMLKKIGAVMELPNEKPSIITVVDREKLQDQEFFKKAANGDKILVYEGARRIILFRPSTGKVIDMVPLAFKTPESPSNGVEEAVTPFPAQFQNE